MRSFTGEAMTPPVIPAAAKTIVCLLLELPVNAEETPAMLDCYNLLREINDPKTDFDDRFAATIALQRLRGEQWKFNEKTADAALQVKP